MSYTIKPIEPLSIRSETTLEIVQRRLEDGPDHPIGGAAVRQHHPPALVGTGIRLLVRVDVQPGPALDEPAAVLGLFVATFDISAGRVAGGGSCCKLEREPDESGEVHAAQIAELSYFDESPLHGDNIHPSMC